MSDPASSAARTWFGPILRCPDCGGGLHLNKTEARCALCSFRRPQNGKIDLRPCAPQPRSLVLPSHAPDVQKMLESINIEIPAVTYTGPPAIRDSRWLLSAMREYTCPPAALLDLGCGPRDQAIPVEHMGYRYVGIDYSNEAADILADAHIIPFQSASFDCVLSYAVLQHLHNPFAALFEIARVLKPGGVFVGTVSQGEPFCDSFFHLTTWGLISLVGTVPGLRIERMWRSRDTLEALAAVGRYPRIIRFLIGIVHRIDSGFPVLAPRRLKWPRRRRELERLFTAGSICFLIRKTS